MLKIAICDDDSSIQKKIILKVSEVVNELKEETSIDTFSSGMKLLDVFKKNKYDIVLLDINLPDIGGKELASKLRKSVDYRFSLVFISDYSVEVFNTFSLDIDSFIPKDYLDKNFKREMSRIVNQVLKEKNKKIEKIFYIKDRNGTREILVDIKSIMYAEITNKRISLHINFSEYKIINITFSKLKELLLEYGFCDIHRTCIVNPRYIAAYSNVDVKMTDGEIFPISRYKVKEVKKSIEKYIISEMDNYDE